MVKDLMVIPCDECGGAGFLFWGDENNFDVEACECAEENFNV